MEPNLIHGRAEPRSLVLFQMPDERQRLRERAPMSVVQLNLVAYFASEGRRYSALTKSVRVVFPTHQI